MRLATPLQSVTVLFTPSFIVKRDALWLSLCLPIVYRSYYHCLGTDAAQYDINFYQVARRHIPEQRNNHGHCRENHKPHLFCACRKESCKMR